MSRSRHQRKPGRRATLRTSRFLQPAVRLRPHQQTVVNHMKTTQQRGVLLWHSLGSGKTITSLAIAQLSPTHPIVVICPASMRDQWRASMRQMHISTKRFSLHSYEGFGNDVEAGRVRTTGAVLILDEVHRIRNAAGKNAKTIEHASRDAHRVVCLSGTPMVNNVLDLSSVINLITGEPTLPVTEKPFRDTFYVRVHRATTVPKAQRCKVYSDVTCSESGKITTHGSGLCRYHEYLMCRRSPIAVKRQYGFTRDKAYEASEDARIKEARMKMAHVKVRPDTRKYVECLNGYVSCYSAPARVLAEYYPSQTEVVRNVAMSPVQMKQYKVALRKIAKSEVAMIQKREQMVVTSHAFNVFLNATRQISNTWEGATDTPKLQGILQSLCKGPRPALVYSNWINNGIVPMAKLLEESPLSHASFTGSLTDSKKKAIVRDYNTGKLDVLLVSTTGTEGLDLKNTRQVHIMEPHWNVTKIEQVIGRAVRYQSHIALPPKDRNVQVVYWVSKPTDKTVGADEYLYQMSRDKKAEMQVFADAVCNHSLETH